MFHFIIYFFFFFKSLIFRIISGRKGVLKGHKMTQNDKQFCLSRSISQEPSIIWLWFLVHMCKMMISLANFFIFQNFDFGVLGGWKGKKWPKLPILACFPLYLRNCRLYHSDFVNDNYRCFSLFFEQKCSSKY